jgi:hypothetical protein
MGSTVTGGTLNLQILAKDEDSNESFTKVVVFKNGVVLETINLNPWINNVSITRALTGVNKDYFYVKVTQADGNEAISSPVFIEGTVNQAPLVSITNPANNASFDLGVPVAISATATDGDGTISKVEFYQGTVKLGEDLTTPYEYAWSPATAGTYQLTVKATDNLAASTVSAPVTVTVTATDPVIGTIVKRIAAGSDDAEQYLKGGVVLVDPALNIVYESRTSGNQTIGLRFAGLAIPQGATITKAYLEFTADKTSTGSSSLTIRGEAADNATAFTTVSKNLSSRIKTTATVSWAPGQWSTGLPSQSGELKTIIQEIVNRTGWASGNSMVILITGTGTRTAESFEGSPTAAPLIHIEYTSTKSGMIQENTAMPTATNEIAGNGILVYPNPVRDVLTVRFNGKTEVERILIY